MHPPEWLHLNAECLHYDRWLCYMPRQGQVWVGRDEFPIPETCTTCDAWGTCHMQKMYPYSTLGWEAFPTQKPVQEAMHVAHATCEKCIPTEHMVKPVQHATYGTCKKCIPTEHMFQKPVHIAMHVAHGRNVSLLSIDRTPISTNQICNVQFKGDLNVST